MVYMKIYSTHLKLKKMSNKCDFDRIWKLKATCDISPETAELIISMNLKEMRETRICEEQDF